MAIRAFFRCRLIKQNRPAVHFPLSFVAIPARYMGVRSRQEEAGLAVIETGHPPFRDVVTDVALRLPGCGMKLSHVNIFVASSTLRGRVAKSGAAQVRRKRSRFMAKVTGHGAMPGGEREPGGRMIELRQVAPGAGVVTTHAADNRGARLSRRRCSKLPPVGI